MTGIGFFVTIMENSSFFFSLKSTEYRILCTYRLWQGPTLVCVTKDRQMDAAFSTYSILSMKWCDKAKLRQYGFLSETRRESSVKGS